MKTYRIDIKYSWFNPGPSIYETLELIAHDINDAMSLCEDYCRLCLPTNYKILRINIGG